jgi:hypothetical protein
MRVELAFDRESLVIRSVMLVPAVEVLGGIEVFLYGRSSMGPELELS